MRPLVEDHQGRGFGPGLSRGFGEGRPGPARIGCDHLTKTYRMICAFAGHPVNVPENGRIFVPGKMYKRAAGEYAGMAGRDFMRRADAFRVGAGVSGLLLACLGLSGCIGGPTYGTDKTAMEQLADDLGSSVAIGQDPNKNKGTKYNPRPALVLPPNRHATRSSSRSSLWRARKTASGWNRPKRRASASWPRPRQTRTIRATARLCWPATAHREP